MKNFNVSRQQRLYQVNVEDSKGQLLRVGPAMLQDACNEFASTIKEQIALGREKNWRNPHVVPLIHLEN